MEQYRPLQEFGRPSDWGDGRERDLPELRPGQLLLYLSPLKGWWRLIASATALVVIVTGLVSKFWLTKWYRATAILHPVAQPSVQGRLSGLLGGLSGGMASMPTILGAPANDAERYLTILRSFAFTTSLAEQHGLVPELLWDGTGEITKWRSSHYPRWTVYRILSGRFSCKYSVGTGNLTLYYDDPDATGAQRMLEFYIEDLRAKLRRQDIQDAAAAIRSLQEETRNTSDALLQQQLYELIARQIQHQTLAQVEADFAFAVLEPPVAPDKPFRPSTANNCAFAGLLTAFGLSGSILAFHYLRDTGARGTGAGPARPEAGFTRTSAESHFF